jgi:hypothetical protein
MCRFRIFSGTSAIGFPLDGGVRTEDSAMVSLSRGASKRRVWSSWAGGTARHLGRRAASARRRDLAVQVVDPSETHDYQPLWTLVGAGVLPREAARRPKRA